MKKRWYLGRIKGRDKERVFLEDFEWACGWYWRGGSIVNDEFGAHFDGCFLEVPDIRGHPLGHFVTPWTVMPDYLKTIKTTTIENGCSVWEPLSFFLDDSQYSEAQWWRIKDLFKQFYAIQAAAECFQYGGHCCDGHTPPEINPSMAAQLNAHIEKVIIPAIRVALDKVA